MTEFKDILSPFGLDNLPSGDLPVHTPIDGGQIAVLKQDSPGDLDTVIQNARHAFEEWRQIPAPLRGEFVRILGQVLRQHKQALGKLVTLECGKILSEGLGEVQEMIDICDFAVGLSRQLYGLTMPSERPGHHMRETWHPIGPVAIISAFNFPVAVWSWNAAIALVCGNPLIWKPSEKTPLTALACQMIFEEAAALFKAEGHALPDHLSQVLIGDAGLGQALIDRPEIALVSATGSVPMGRVVGQSVAKRLGRSLLELGGNNAMIVMPSADLDMAVRAILFGAVGTAGQRCTSTRRLLVHHDIRDQLEAALTKAYGSVKIGNPLEPQTLVGPLIDQAAVEAMQDAVARAKAEEGQVLSGGQSLDGQGHYVEPALIRMPRQSSVVCHETFAPILYTIGIETLKEGIALNNAVPQGLSSCIFTNDVREAEEFLSAIGSDCGIANVNIGTSGAEIGGAFGGEKETGGGRESGSDAWKTYMRRQTQTINWSRHLPLAQGVSFDV